MLIKEVADKHGVPVEKVLGLLTDAGIAGKDESATLTEAEQRWLENHLPPAVKPRTRTAAGGAVKVIRAGTGPVVRRPVVRSRGGHDTASHQSGRQAADADQSGQAKSGGAADSTPRSGEGRRQPGGEGKVRDFLRNRRMREAGVHRQRPGEEAPAPPAEATPPAEPAPVSEQTPVATDAKPVEPAPQPAETPAPQPTAQEPTQPATAKQAKPAPAQAKPKADSPKQAPKRKQVLESRPPKETPAKPAAGAAPPPKPGAPPAKGGGRRSKKKKTEELAEKREERESRKQERKVLASILGGKKGRKQSYKRVKRDRQAAAEEARREEEERQATTLQIHEATTVADVAHGLGVNASEIQAMLLDLGKIVTVNQHLDRECIDLIADEYGFEVESASLMDFNPFEEFEQEDQPEDLLPRPPVITVMGHVDHGKTKLLDAIRSADVVSTEAGGITQHIGAYYVHVNNSELCFLDTPGHEAFTAMRARGAMVTDVVVLVVAADDGVMPQTKEAIAHAKAAGVPIIVAINKVDLPAADVTRVKQELAAEELVPEDWGGKTPVAEISALKRVGIDDLLDLILIQSELLELKANPNRAAQGTVVEVRMEQGRGVVATVLVQNGTLQVGDPLVAGVHQGKVRALYDDHGKKLKEAHPGRPAVVLGLSGTPVAGDEVRVVPDERTARELAGRLQQIQRERELSQKAKTVSLENFFDHLAEGSIKELNLVIKADVQGSVEAVADSLTGIESEKVKVRILHRAVGSVAESDIMLAAASQAIVLGFNVAIPAEVASVGDREGVDVRTYNVIYDAIEDVRKAMEGLLEEEVHEKVFGHFEILQIFRTSKAGLILGGNVTDGKLLRKSKIRHLRQGELLGEGRLTTLRRFKDEVNEVPEGLECGVGVDGLSEIREGDVFECFQLESVAATL